MSESGVENTIKSAAQFEDTREGWQRRWDAELSAALENQKKFHDDGRKVVQAFLVKEQGSHAVLPLFTSNVQTLQSLLYGKVPKVDVKRRWGDPNDVAGRAAGEMIQRLLNTDIERDSDTYTGALLYVLTDRLIPGFGLARLRYTADFREKKVEAVFRRKRAEDGSETDEFELDEQGEKIQLAPGYTEDEKTFEDVLVDYLHWDDTLWSSGSKIFEEWRWAAFRCPMTQDELVARFASKLSEDPEEGERIARELPLNSKDNKKGSDKELVGQDPWQRADVWEIWDKENRKVWWVIQGFHFVLDSEDDPYGLEGFWPFPRPVAANLTTDAYLPRADYIIAADTYDEINVITGRIALLEKAIRVAGLYNGTSDAVKRLLSEAGLNELIGVEDWRTFAEGGGIKGNIEWFPLEQVSAAIQILEQQRQSKISLLYQITGMSDIMRGESSGPTTATEQAIKAKFASVRVTHFQEDFARFASDLQRLRAELMCKLCDDQTLITRSNIMFTADKVNVSGALALLKSQFASYRIEVKPESISATDYAAMTQERVQLIQTVAQFLQAMAPIGQAEPAMVPPLLEMLRWMFTGFRGANTIEQVLDQAVEMAKGLAQQAAQAKLNPPPDPKVEAEKVRAGVAVQQSRMDMQEAQFDHAAHMAETQADIHKKQIDTQLDLRRMEGEIQRDAVRAATAVAPQPPPGGGSK